MAQPICLCLAVLSLSAFAAAPPAARYNFADPAALGADSSGGNHTAVVRNATPFPSPHGPAISLNGDGGIEVTDTGFLKAEGGFAFECSLKFDSVAIMSNISSKEGEWLLRLDPQNEGGAISFFVDLNGMLEPRVSSFRVQAGVWYHLVATYDGGVATLWINGQRFTRARAGALKDTANPALIGLPTKSGIPGLQGMISDVRLYNQPLTDGDVLQAVYGLGEAGAGELAAARFEFVGGADGWEAWQAEGLAATDGVLRAQLTGPLSAITRRGLRVPTAEGGYVCVRMAADAGKEGRLVFTTDAGTGAITFPIVADGAMHSYVLAAGEEVEWDGDLKGLALAPSDVATQTAVDFVRVTRTPKAPPEFTVEQLYPVPIPCRAGRDCDVLARVRNTGGDGEATATLSAQGARVVGEARLALAGFAHGESRELRWNVRAEAAGDATLRLDMTGAGATPNAAERTVSFTPPVEITKADYVPEPRIADTGEYLVGAHYCPLWKQGSRSGGWQEIVPFPEREPALGWYDEDNPEVTDWEIKWALDHGIQYFVYCWYRNGQNKPVEHFLGHAIHEGLFKSRYGDEMQFTIMWENQSKGHSGVSSEEDLLQNLLPYWIETYFRRDNYLKVDGKPVLFIYRPEYLVDDLGSVENVRSALDKMREACKAAGFAGLTILGEHRGMDAGPLKLMAEEGLDYAFAYCWPVNNPPTPEDGIKQQEEFWEAWRKADAIPYLLTLSMGWDSTPWSFSYSKWHLPPADFERLCERGKAAADALPEGSLGRKLILLDNWNEFGEGHYIAPHRELGFGYLDAVRNAFTSAPKEHVDLVPGDLGLGPYQEGYRRFVESDLECARRVLAPGGDEPGLLAWWSFDDPEGSPYALDYSGHCRGGILRNASRAPGIKGQALVCTGGNVSVPAKAFPQPLRGLTVECWLKTDVAGQTDKWFANNEYGDGASGMRFGLNDGRLCFAVPQSRWSHHFVAPEPLPLGRWVHVAGTYDGKLLRIYQDGKEVASLPRSGKTNGANTHFSLGSYDQDHKAFFSGLLDEVRVYSRALMAEQIAARAKAD